MRGGTPGLSSWPLGVVLAALAAGTPAARQDELQFRSGVEVVGVPVTVTDEDGRFVKGLNQSDFTIYDDGLEQAITYFSADRVPVSLGIVLDASGSMTPDKVATARRAIDRFVVELLGAQDELFLMEFAGTARLAAEWTANRHDITRAIGTVEHAGGTAMYDAVAAALPIAGAGRNRKKALLLISDGNDTASSIRPAELRARIRGSEVLVYALGIDGFRRPASARPAFRLPVPAPFPVPVAPRGPTGPPPIQEPDPWPRSAGDRVDAAGLRQITDDTGGRTEVVRRVDGLNAATTRLADELRQQYYLSYARPARRDGRWHAITVEVRHRKLIVRARKGYVAS
jgi:VWFA-related protein